jgi:hypothetical protein
MNGNGKHPYRSSDSVLRAIVLVPLLVFFFTGLVQCSKTAVDDAKPTPKVPRTVICNGYAIPLFSTPVEQLRHALGWFPDLHEKKAALEIVNDAFPDARTIHAEARLDLAYLALGRDYRYATPVQCRTAIGKYKKILSGFSDLPAICAEANWYIGWILADLLDEPGKAAKYFQTVVETYPDTTLQLKSTVPWVSLVLPQVEKMPQAQYARPTYYWSSIALLELVRTSERQADKWSAFEKLYADHRSSQATGYAIRELLGGSPSLRHKITAYAKQHLKTMMFSGPMEKDIHALMQNADLLEPPTHNRQNPVAE